MIDIDILDTDGEVRVSMLLKFVTQQGCVIPVVML
jgi:hypothetical protein